MSTMWGRPSRLIVLIRSGAMTSVQPSSAYRSSRDARKARSDVLELHFRAMVRLPGIGRIATDESGLEHGACGGSAATCDGRVDDIDIWVLYAERIKDGLQRSSFTAGGPPGENLDILIGRCLLRLTGIENKQKGQQPPTRNSV